MAQTVVLTLNTQQLDLLDRTLAVAGVVDRLALIRLALEESRHSPKWPPALPLKLEKPATHTCERGVIDEHILQPGTGKAFEVRQGQVLRIEQIAGPQCVDFNCFNLHDYKEAMHVGRIRAVHGLKPTAGHFIWSAPPRERAMMYWLADTVGRNDVMFARCSAYLYESVYGFASHTNCHDIQAEAQREYGLTPDDVHDSLNFFMDTVVDGDRATIRRQHAMAGDFVELLALIDVLAVPNVCGNDVGRTSNFELKPVKVSVLQAFAEDLGSVPAVPVYPTNLRSPATFRQARIKASRELRRDAAYTPDFTNVPLRMETVEVPLDRAACEYLAGSRLVAYYGDDLGAILRDVLFSWWEMRFAGGVPGT